MTEGLGITVVLVVGATGVMAGDLSVGSLVAVVPLLAVLSEPLHRVATPLANLEEVRAQFARIGDVRNYPLDPAFKAPPVPNAAVRGKARLSGLIELRGLTFGYDRLGPPLIEELDLTILPGRRVALVGGSGSGKSTVARLVAGLYRPWAGEILFDGLPAEAIPVWLRKTSIGWVDEEVALFGGSVTENLTLWDGSVGEATIARAAQDAAIHDVIAARTGGYGHRVHEGGTNVSGGEGQRLQIPRAFALDPSIVILDEATSALDPLLEREIDVSIRRRGVTALIVAPPVDDPRLRRDHRDRPREDRGARITRGAAGAWGDLP